MLIKKDLRSQQPQSPPPRVDDDDTTVDEETTIPINMADDKNKVYSTNTQDTLSHRSHRYRKRRNRRRSQSKSNASSQRRSEPYDPEIDWRGPGNYKSLLSVTPNVHCLPVLCYLGLAWLRYPVILGEFFRLVQEERIPFATAYRQLPRRWRLQCSGEQYYRLRPNVSSKLAIIMVTEERIR